MWMKRWMPFITTVCNSCRFRRVALLLCYLAILIALMLMYGNGAYIAPPFIYQNF